MEKQDRFKTLLVIVIGLTAISWIFKISWLVEVAFGIGLLSIFIPPFAKAVEWGWLKLALGLGYVNSRILLSVIFFVFLMPIAFVARLFSKDPLMLKSKNLASVYVDRDHLFTKEDLENIW